MRFSAICLSCLLLFMGGAPLSAADPDDAFRMTPGVSRGEVLRRTLAPFAGPSNHGVDPTTLTGKVMCGYQGWFTCPGDGAGRGWHHWGRGGRFEPGACSIDLWPDVSELPSDLRYDTPFKLPSGEPAQVYSPLDAATVDLHFQWMADHGIDGVFVQRFGVEVRGAAGLHHFNRVLSNCRAGANRHGRAWAVMYDLSGLPEGGTQTVIDDWKQLVDRARIAHDPADQAYLRHNGKPVVAVWGVGFNDNRRYTLEECARLIDFLANDPEYGGACVMLGVPTYWRTLSRDCLPDERLHDILRSADIVSPWMVGRFRTPEEAERIAAEVWRPDLQWCREQRLDYLPVVFPGFSWHNMRPDTPLGATPRLGGRFLWEQFRQLRLAGATMVYQAMFDEVDEATAIFKCTNQPPEGESRFLDYEGLPSDHYLWLVGQGGRLIRGEIPPTPGLPPREAAQPHSPNSND
ncbi:hypothetical protein KOR34_51580 [Posidoniimonas corsicana]|uniref:Xylosidase/arabinosidase n=1 Tax=Posidoniimonas corsicana TaxID=1938618 RepID=A0A5C5UT85_9BACT|nr:glycoside hydrolase family 71/99-like protein [Posidoniimonas corsicana]TWT29604.1 hypothetical protein KOR34_51580 [Posidoniimonas corsicana]